MVFPVPDGDTGTNMCMTMQSAVKELKGCQGDTVSDVASSISLGALKGARGNSGVILSQLFRGFAKAVKDKDTMDPKLLAEALRLGTEAAYKAVMRPKEGTMLTVSRMISDAVNKAYAEGASTLRLIETMLSSGALSLEMTPAAASGFKGSRRCGFRRQGTFNHIPRIQDGCRRGVGG